MENENESPDECEVDGVTYMEYEFHALHTFFPGLDESEFNALRRFSGKNLTRGCTADFWRDDKSVDYWHYWIGDIQTQTMSKSIKPMASRGICLVLDACGGGVVIPMIWNGGVPPVPVCSWCGAVAVAHGNVIPMRPPAINVRRGGK